VNIIKEILDNNFIILDKKMGDVNGDGIADTVYLVAKKADYPNSPFLTDIKVIIIDGNTSVSSEIALANNSGYNPTLFLGPFTNRKLDDIFVSINSGGSGGFGYYYLYSYVNNRQKLLFDTSKFNNSFLYEINYKDNYRVEVINKTLEKFFIIDISNKDKEYLANIYDEKGKLIRPTAGEVLYLNNLYPFDINGDGVYDLYALNRVIGLYGADTLGNIETYLLWDSGSFKPFGNMQYLSVSGSNLK